MGLYSKAITTGRTIKDLDIEIDNCSLSTVEHYQNFFDKGYGHFCFSADNHQKKKRKSVRFRVTGIVALTNFEQPVVTTICDIAPGGVSFFHAGEKDITNNEFKMDILIFDSQTDRECFISQIKGRIKSKNLVVDPKSKEPRWRFSIEFLDNSFVLHRFTHPRFKDQSHQRTNNNSWGGKEDRDNQFE